MLRQLFVICLVVICSFNILPQTNIEKFRISQDSLGFGGQAELLLTLMAGNSNLQLLTGQFRLNYNGGNNYTFGVLGGDFGWKDGKQFSNEALFHIRHVNTLSVFFQIEFFGQADYSKPRKLLLRRLIGSGVRLRFIKTKEVKFNLGVGGMYEWEKYDLPLTAVHPQKLNTFRGNSYVNTEIDFNTNVKFLSTIYFQPAVIHPADFRVLGENSFSSTLTKNLSLVISLNFRHDSRPPDGVKNFDINSQFGFNYSF